MREGTLDAPTEVKCSFETDLGRFWLKKRTIYSLLTFLVPTDANGLPPGRALDRLEPEDLDLIEVKIPIGIGLENV